MDVQSKRLCNERKFTSWAALPDGGRKYVLEVSGKHGWLAKYIKVVDKAEETVRFYQEIYNAKKVLVEVHEKFPKDLGHRIVAEEER